MDKNQILVISDAGHGGHDHGATTKMPIEAFLNLRLSAKLEAWLSKRGIAVIMTRTADLFVSLQGRCDIANAYPSTCFVSWHCNSHTSRASGFEVFTSPGDTAADPFAQSVIDKFGQVYPDLTIRSDRTDGDDDKEARFKVLTGTNCPAILVEAGFISNREDLWRILQDANQEQLVEIVGLAIIDTFGSGAS